MPRGLPLRSQRAPSRHGRAPDWRRCASDVHVLRDWCWLGTARDEGELARLIEAPPRPTFDIDVAKLLLRRHKAGALPLLPIKETWSA